MTDPNTLIAIAAIELHVTGDYSNLFDEGVPEEQNMTPDQLSKFLTENHEIINTIEDELVDKITTQVVLVKLR